MGVGEERECERYRCWKNKGEFAETIIKASTLLEGERKTTAFDNFFFIQTLFYADLAKAQTAQM